VETGDKISADGRLLESTTLSSDESSLTGESVPVKKSAEFMTSDPKTPVAERFNMLYSGCFITGGSGKMVVTAVGDKTEFGKIAHELSESQKGSTPLQERLAKLGKTITILGTSAAAFIFIVQLVTFYMNNTLKADTVFDAFITSIVLIVAAVPEGLPTIVAVSLALNIIKMSKQNALVKKLIACETIGSVNVISSDKTGTLTQNKMTVAEIYSDKKIYKPKELKNNYMTANFCVNSTADVAFFEHENKFMGNPTECALIVAYHKTQPDISYKQIRESADIIHSYPFSSETKNMVTIVQNKYRCFSVVKRKP
jgi:Ca2+-transporting ATPase